MCTRLEHAHCLETINNMWFLGKKADFDDSEIKRNRSEVFSKWNKCRIYVGPLIECHMNRFEYCHPDNNSDNDSFGSFLSKNRIFCNITRC
jgi:uncharacterized protein YmfQ (DUF2313 family)